MMKEWIIFSVFSIVGLGMLITGISNMIKEKHDAESVKIYRGFSIVGGIVLISSILYKVFG
ncbi:hypothetical protein [Sporomusa sp. KB1]|uniref:hypothetical protein n=1 Tax=Sporomusa sp. KB1 TaxID=943346 RepID=UPI0011ABCAAE|nr:hypothetical protein [Sporomusa sp. KB1]TWH47734.1 hypothetical protein Salpa_3814 [Sporomusa sp. KB1]